MFNKMDAMFIWVKRGVFFKNFVIRHARILRFIALFVTKKYQMIVLSYCVQTVSVYDLPRTDGQKCNGKPCGNDAG